MYNIMQNLSPVDVFLIASCVLVATSAILYFVVWEIGKRLDRANRLIDEMYDHVFGQKNDEEQFKTLIVSFIIIDPNHEMETRGEILKLSAFGEYCPDNSLRGYKLAYLLKNSSSYQPYEIMDQGQITKRIPINL